MTELAIELTELEKLEVTRVDAVNRPANGFPVLMMKGLAAKGQRDCPKCDKSYDADHQGANCENCGTKLPPVPDAAKAAAEKVNCPTCKGDGKIMGNQRDCPDCDASGKVSPDKADRLAAKSVWYADAVALVKKAMVRGKVDESQDIDGGQQAIALVGKLIGYEAQELAAGNLGEAGDIELLSAAASLLRQWVSGESAVQDGNVMPATTLMQSAAVDEELRAEFYAWYAAKADMSTADINDLPDSAFAYIEDGGSKDEGGKTTPRSLRHFPVHDAAHAKNALSRAPQSPFGDKAMPKIKAAAKKFGIGDDTAKSAVAEGGSPVDTVTQEVDGSQIAKAVEDAVAKATAPLEKRIQALDAELAKVKATPIPGGPHMSAVPRGKGADGDDRAAKAQRVRDTADALSSDPAAADAYRQWAREIEAEGKSS